MVSSHNLDATFPLSGTVSEKLAFLLRYAILAPSPQNSQPWRFEVNHGGINVSVDRSRALLVADPLARAATISAGTTIGHLETALKAHRLQPRVEYLNDRKRPDLVARIEVAREYASTLEDVRIFDQISRRHTAARFRPDTQVPPAVLSELTQTTIAYRAGMRWVDHGPMQWSVGSLIQEADQALFSGKRFREEFAAWIRTRTEEARDGVPVSAFGTARALEPLVPWLIEHTDVSRVAGKEDFIRASTAPALGVLFTHRDERFDWLDAGRALSALLLRAVQMGYQCALFEEPLSSERLRNRLCALLNTGSAPQAILRIGVEVASTEVPTPRRPVEEFLFVEPS